MAQRSPAVVHWRSFRGSPDDASVPRSTEYFRNDPVALDAIHEEWLAHPITQLLPTKTTCTHAPLASSQPTRYSFYNTNQREDAHVESTAPAGMFVATPHRVRRVAGDWLGCYPTFQDALRRSETSFGRLPRHARLAALKRATEDAAADAIATTILDEVGASFVELSTCLVEEAVERYLATQADSADSHAVRNNNFLDDLAEQIVNVSQPHVARPPCVLRPGQGIFLDGWMRFFSYRARGDKTIPLLAIDWISFHERLCFIRS
ncbi:hypothetical protein R70199_07371 [Paraburkholderia domus]|nr:hypothetical protein R70199_07371 [Paraburkholderia domus]